jgi:murein DD-endopeptidase MepM/ murein hydrolase activator NlpD
VTATDGSWFRNTASQTVGFVTDNTAPQVLVAKSSLSVTRGTTLAFYIRSSEPLSEISGDFLSKSRTFYRVEPTLWRALVGLPIVHEDTHSMFHLTLSDHSGNRSVAAVPVSVEAGTFPAGGTIRLTPAQVAARRDDLSRAKTRKERADVYRHRLPEARWTGVMLRPTTGRRTSGFGRYRTYSDGRRSYHYGTDLASPTGTPVNAAAAGLVRQAGWQHIFGNVVIIDHGQGVSTSYNHLSAVDVEVGAQVDAGELVGRVGSTGQSTGPHLHWGLVVDGVSVDPEEWLLRDFLGGEHVDFVDVTQLNGGAVWTEE